MPGTQSIEDLLEGKKSACECINCSFLINYRAMRNYLHENYYSWIQANCPWFTDHGENHIDSVLNTITDMISPNIKESLNCLDLYLLLTSVIWHDVGMVSNRANHPQEVKTIIEEVRKVCLSNETIRRLITSIVRAHSGREGWSFLEVTEPVSACPKVANFEVFPQSLAALLRFSDEASETRMRISPALLSKVPHKQKIYWQYANCISASKPEPFRRRLILAIELQRTAAVRKFICPLEMRERSNRHGRISLIEYIVCRIEKMNNERAYCFPYLTRYADIRNVLVRVKICDSDEVVINEEIELGDGGLASSDYPDIKLYDDFFHDHPQLSLTKLEEGL